MKVISKGIRAIWFDKSIKKSRKGDFKKEWLAYFACNSIDRFYDLLNQEGEPSKTEENFIVSKVKEYWLDSNPLGDVEKTILRHEKENKPIVKRSQTIRIKKIRVKKF